MVSIWKVLVRGEWEGKSWIRGDGMQECGRGSGKWVDPRHHHPSSNLPATETADGPPQLVQTKEKHSHSRATKQVKKMNAIVYSLHDA